MDLASNSKNITAESSKAALKNAHKNEINLSCKHNVVFARIFPGILVGDFFLNSNCFSFSIRQSVFVFSLFIVFGYPCWLN